MEGAVEVKGLDLGADVGVPGAEVAGVGAAVGVKTKVQDLGVLEPPLSLLSGQPACGISVLS